MLRRFDRTTYTLIEGGFTIRRVRFGIWKSLRTIRYADVSDVHIRVLRFPKPAMARPIYAHSLATFRFVDSHGEEIGTIAGHFDEPRQHEYVWLPNDKIDFSTPSPVVAVGLNAHFRFRNYREPGNGAYR